jgi:hypothetical protein
MNLKTIRVELAPSDIQEILMIALDDDKEGSLDFIKEKLAKRVQKTLTPH